jgi:hypothetical protein
MTSNETCLQNRVAMLNKETGEVLTGMFYPNNMEVKFDISEIWSFMQFVVFLDNKVNNIST